MFAIKWRNEVTKTAGSGLFIHNKITAETICGLANKDNPAIHHWCEVGDPED